MAAISILCAMLGFLSPANRGGLLTATLLLFVLMGVPAGYTSANTYKSLKGVEWKTATILTAFLYPSLIALTFFVLNFFIWAQARIRTRTRTPAATCECSPAATREHTPTTPCACSHAHRPPVECMLALRRALPAPSPSRR